MSTIGNQATGMVMDSWSGQDIPRWMLGFVKKSPLLAEKHSLHSETSYRIPCRQFEKL
ncbi:hypothetical protein E4U13_000123 [Claviceps humidiphila]|uniref:Uncharacterized protein n=1 Tax=Claviceps humidiphila TaxID=1294629 RepID=A0A9P7TUN9_9HYPO|nr:hypothetical protein E4U13_000123 [Claviceps humidiphila]